MARKKLSAPAPAPESEPEPEPEPESEPEPDIKEEEAEEESEPEPDINEEEAEEESEEKESSEEASEEEESEEEESEKEESEGEEESDEDLSNRETLLALLEPFGKDQLIELLKEAAARNPSLLSRISESAESDPAHRKIFVHGVWDCTSETLAASFRPFGDIEECRVVSDHTTGRSKGYGFVLFRTRRGARNALKEPQKIIGGRATTSQLASKGNSPAAADGGSGSGRKVYVSNIGTSVNPERLKAFFAKFGEIEEGPLGYDKTSGKLRGYAIFMYKTAEGCKKALEEPAKVFDGCILQCRRALEGVKPKVPGAMTVPAVSALPPNNIALTYASSYGNPAGGLLGQGMGVQSGGAGLLNPVGGQSGGVGWLNPVGGQSAGVGLLNPVAGVSLLENRSVTPTSYVAGAGVNTVSPSVIGSYQSQAALRGLGGYQSPTSYVAGTGVNTVSPSVIGSYQSQAALQGLGGYQSQSTMNPGMRSQSSLGSSGSGLPSYLGR